MGSDGGYCGFFGMGTKQVMVSVPIVAVIFDRLFLAENWREIWAKRKLFYVGLIGSWE